MHIILHQFNRETINFNAIIQFKSKRFFTPYSQYDSIINAWNSLEFNLLLTSILMPEQITGRVDQ